MLSDVGKADILRQDVVLLRFPEHGFDNSHFRNWQGFQF